MNYRTNRTIHVGCAVSVLLVMTSAPIVTNNTKSRSLLSQPGSKVKRIHPVTTKEPTRAQVSDAYGQVPLSFEANQGQTDSRVKFVARTGGQALFLTSTEALLKIGATRPNDGTWDSRAVVSPSLERGPNLDPSEYKTAVLRIKLIDANQSPNVTGLDELPGKSNYFIGDDPRNWQVNVPNYARVKYEQVYPGVDVVYYGNRRQLEYDLIVAPGADAGQIRISFGGANTARIDESGDLVLGTAAGETRQHKPFIYQEVDGIRESIPGGYVMSGNGEIGFAVATYDKSKPLIIDPVLAYSTYLGGSLVDQVWTMTVDSNGSAYVAGRTFSADFPTLMAVQPVLHAEGDVFVTKLNASGTALVYSTFIGGNRLEQANGIAVDASGYCYLTGVTQSNDFPVANALQPVHVGFNNEGFVAKLNPSGNEFVYSTYLGGNGSDGGNSIAADAAGNAHVTGSTSSTDFRLKNPLQANFAIPSDCFITKINSTGSELLYSTYFGGTGLDSGRGIALDSAGNIYVAGETDSTDFPLMNPVQSVFADKTFFRSTDGAVNWVGTNNGLPLFLLINVIAVDPATPSTVYAGTVRGGLFKSTDSGSSWNEMNKGLLPVEFINVTQVVVDPLNGSTLYCLDSGRIMKSTNGGESWIKVLSPPTIRALTIDPITPSNLLAVATSSLFKSTDAGATWQTKPVRDLAPPFPISAQNLQSIAIDPTHPSTIYAGDGGRSLFKSTDGGNTWQGHLGLLTGIAGINVDPLNSATLYEWSSSSIAKSTDFGNTWNSLVRPIDPGFIRTVVIDPMSPSTIYAGTDRGLFKSSNGGTTWNPTPTRLTYADVQAVAVNPHNSSIVFAGAERTFDCFVVKLNSSGSALAYSTFLGGDSNDSVGDIAVDGFGNAYVSGATESLNFPTKNPFRGFAGGSSDAFVTKLNQPGSLVYSTYFGGSGVDGSGDVAVDTIGNVTISGRTTSVDFPLSDPIQATQSGGRNGDAFVSKMNGAATALLFSTYLGGGGEAFGSQFAAGHALDAAGNLFLAGQTASSEFPVTPNAFQETKPSSNVFFGTGFVAKIAFADICLQNESNRSWLQIETTTGAYSFSSCAGVTLSGTGILTRRGCLITLQVNGPDRRMLVRIDTCARTGIGSIQNLSNGAMLSILDRNISNNNCLCSGN